MSNIDPKMGSNVCSTFASVCSTPFFVCINLLRFEHLEGEADNMISCHINNSSLSNAVGKMSSLVDYKCLLFVPSLRGEGGGIRWVENFEGVRERGRERRMS